MHKTSFEKQNVVPIYKQLSKYLREEIKGGRFSKGFKLLSEINLADKYLISRTTVRKALNELINEKLLVRQQGKGTFVANRHKLSKSNKQPLLAKTVGLILPTINVSYFSDIARGVEDAGNRNGYHIIFCNSDSKLEKEETYMQQLYDKKIEGLIISPTRYSHKNKYWKKLIRTKIPFVIVDTLVNGLDADYIVTDDIDGSYRAVKHLINLGHKRIGHIRGTETTSTGADRMKGYKKAIVDSGLVFDKNLIQGDDYGNRKYASLVTEKFLKMDSRPTAIFAASDILALGVYDAIIRAGLRVPEDIALVGYANLTENTRMDVPLTTVHQPGYKMGKAACERLIDKIKNKKHGETKKIVFKTKLVIRRSCGSKKRKGGELEC